MRVLGPLLLTLYVVRRVRNNKQPQPLRPVARSAVDNAAARGRRGQRCALTPDRPPPAHALPTAPLHRGRPGTPPCIRTAHLNSPKPKTARELGVGHGQPQAVAHPATGAPVPEPLRLGDEAAGARCAGARQGAQPRGRGRAAPRQGRPRRGPEPGGCLYSAPLGGLIGIPARARPALIADKHSQSLCL